MDRVDFTLTGNEFGFDHYMLSLGVEGDAFYLDTTPRILRGWNRKPTVDELKDTLRFFMSCVEAVADSAYLNQEAQGIVRGFVHLPYFVHYRGREYTHDEVNNGVLIANL